MICVINSCWIFIKPILKFKRFTKISFELQFLFAQVCTLERLKLRFGENCLHFCEVMLKDVADSRRINKTIFSPISNKDEVCLYAHICTNLHEYVIVYNT